MLWFALSQLQYFLCCHQHPQFACCQIIYVSSFICKYLLKTPRQPQAEAATACTQVNQEDSPDLTEHEVWWEYWVPTK